MDREEIAPESWDDVYEVTDLAALAHSKREPRPKSLFGDLWLEGEVSVMFADTGVGKSTLAAEIAENVARGRARKDAVCSGIKLETPFETASAPQKVLLIDLESTPSQFGRRYRRYAFSENLVHVRLDREKLIAKGRNGLEETIKRLTNIHKAKVVVIDSLAYLKRRIDSTNEAAEIMMMLKRMSRERLLSILVVGRSKGLLHPRTLRIADLHTSRAIADLADSIFAIGRSLSDRRLLYIKHLKSRSTELICTASHLPSFHIQRAKDGFLGFAFAGYAAERDVMADNAVYSRDWQLIREVRELSDKGNNIRLIAADLGLARSTAHRLLQISRDENFITLIQPPCPHCGGPAHTRAETEHAAVAAPEPEPYIHPDAFPGEQIFRKIGHLAYEFKSKYEYDSPVERELRRVSYAVGDLGVHEMRQAWKKTGEAPTLFDAMNEHCLRGIDWNTVFHALSIDPEQLRHACDTARTQPPGHQMLPITKWEILDFPGVQAYDALQQKIADALVQVGLLDSSDFQLLSEAALALGKAKQQARTEYAQTGTAPRLNKLLSEEPFNQVNWAGVRELVESGKG